MFSFRKYFLEFTYRSLNHNLIEMSKILFLNLIDEKRLKMKKGKLRDIQNLTTLKKDERKNLKVTKTKK